MEKESKATQVQEPQVDFLTKNENWSKDAISENKLEI